MNQLKLLFVVLATLSYVISAPAIAEKLALNIVGEDGQPMPFAVVTVEGATETLPSVGISQTTVDQIGRRFTPYVSVAPPNADVYFPNKDDTRHSVYSFSGKNSFELQLYRKDDTPPQQFSEPGIVKLGCNIHDSMKAYVVVTENGSARITDELGNVIIDSAALIPGATLSVWHPSLTAPSSVVVGQDSLSSGEVLNIVLAATWKDPQAGKSLDKLENMLRRYSKDAN